jgi:hypothetical protein
MQVFYFCVINATFFRVNVLFLHDFLLKFHAVRIVFKIGYLSLTLQWFVYNFTIIQQNFTKKLFPFFCIDFHSLCIAIDLRHIHWCACKVSNHSIAIFYAKVPFTLFCHLLANVLIV